jgi:hydrogenase nickel incorporation protein HypA/HybF
MHELAVTEAILSVVLKSAEREAAKQVRTVSLRIGEFSDLKAEWIQRYFDYLAKGTVAEKARIEVESTPPRFACDGCGSSFSLSLKGVDRVRCPYCGSDSCSLTGGMEYMVDRLEIET